MFGETLNLDFSYAFLDISQAQEYCEEIANQRSDPGNREHDPDEYKGIMYEVTEALDAVSYYPVMTSRDSDWREFTNAVDAVMRAVEEDRNGNIMNCLEHMEQYLRRMSNRSTNKGY